MSQSFAMPEFEPSANVIELPLERVREVAPEAISTAPEVRSKSAKELADEYGVSDRTVNTWFKTVAAAYCWMEPEALKTGRSAKTRYTPLFQTLLADYRADAANRSDQDWIAAVHVAHADQLPTAAAAPRSAPADDVPLSKTEALSEPTPESEPSIAIVVPKSQIEVLNPEQKSELELIHALYVKPEPVKKFQSIALNGDQAMVVEGVKALHSVVSQIKSENEQIKASIEDRENNVALANEAIEVLKQEGKSAVAENFDLVQKAEELHLKESDAKKRLKSILQALGDF